MAATSRSDDLAEELARTIVDAQAQLRQERELISAEFEAARLQITHECAQRLQEADTELQDLLEERKQLHCAEVRQNDLVSLNVGGQLFTVKRETLYTCPDSFLADLFSGRWEHELQKDQKGNIFLDFDPTLFEALLSWLRDRKIESPERPAAPPRVAQEDLAHFQAMIDFLGLREHLNLQGFCSDGWGEATSSLARPRSKIEGPPTQTRGETKHTERPGLLGTAGSLFSAFYESTSGANAVAEDGDLQTNPPASRTATSPERNLENKSLGKGGRKHLGWSHSQRNAHPSAICGTGDGANIVTISDTRAFASAAAIRATRGYQQGEHYWEIKVHIASDFSYVGFVSAEWTALQSPIGRASHSWGLASNGGLHDGRHDGSASLRASYTSGSTIGWLLKLGPEADQRTASVFVDGKLFEDVFSKLPGTLYPAVSNMRASAQYSILDAKPPPVHELLPKPNHSKSW